VPADVFMHLAGLTSMSGAYQQLARLERAGLAEVRRVDPGYLVGDRHIGCWTLTEAGRRLFAASEAGSGARPGSWYDADRCDHPHGRWTVARQSELPLLVAACRMLAFLMKESADDEDGQQLRVSSWEWPWVRHYLSPARARPLRVRMPAGASFASVTGDGASPTSVLLVPDLGTAPVAHHTQMLRRLAAVRAAWLEAGLGEPDPQLVIATPDPDGEGTREDAWLALLQRVARRHQASPAARVVPWEQVANVPGRSQVAGFVARKSGRHRSPPGPLRCAVTSNCCTWSGGIHS
jgi:hypothetical protein